MQVLHAPIAPDQFDRQPIEQCVLHRLFRPPTKIGYRIDERLAEMPHPNVIDGDAGRKRIARIGNPTRQGSAAARTCRRVRAATLRIGLGGTLQRLERHMQRRVSLAGRIELLATFFHGQPRLLHLLGDRRSPLVRATGQFQTHLGQRQFRGCQFMLARRASGRQDALAILFGKVGRVGRLELNSVFSSD